MDMVPWNVRVGQWKVAAGIGLCRAVRPWRLSSPRRGLGWGAYGDVILAATAQLLGEDGHDVLIETTNVGHLGRFVSAQRWQDIG